MIPLPPHYRILEMVPLFRMNEEEDEAPSYTVTVSCIYLVACNTEVKEDYQ